MKDKLNTVNEENQVEESRLLTVESVARILNISKPMVYKIIGSGDLPYIDMGFRRTLIDPDDLDQYIRNKRKRK